jgi:hypothetical protein
MVAPFNSNIFLEKNKIYQLNSMKSNHMMKPNDMIDYLISIKDYTIITIGDENRVIEDIMYKNDMKVYYVNLNNIFDKNEIIEILENKYKNLYSGEKLWIFYRGFFMGSRDDIYKVIENKKKNKLF